MRTRIKAWVPAMIAIGTLVLIIDGIVLLLRWIGLEKGFAIYLAILIVANVTTWISYQVICGKE